MSNHEEDSDRELSRLERDIEGADRAIDRLQSECKEAYDKIAALEAENAALKSRLAVRQTDREVVQQVIQRLLSAVPPQTDDHGQMLAFIEGRDAQCEIIVRTHVASETEPWRKRCEEAEGLIREALETDYEPPSWDKRARALLATHPATGGGE